MIRREFEQAVSPPVAAELARILPPCDAAPGPGAVLVTASDQSDRAAVTDQADAPQGSPV